MLIELLAQTGQGRGGGGGWNIGPNTIYLIIFLLSLAWSGLAWTARKLKEQRKLREAREREALRQREALRTGRDPVTSAPIDGPIPLAPRMSPPPPPPQPARSAADVERELMERRQQQLRELRKKAAGQQPTPIAPRTPAPQQQPAGPVMVELWPGGPKVLVGQGGPPPAPEPQQRPQPPRPQQQQRPKKKRPAPATASSEPMEARYAPTTIGERPAVRDLSVPVERTRIPLPTTPEQWRAAFIVNEVLGPPVSMR